MYSPTFSRLFVYLSVFLLLSSSASAKPIHLLKDSDASPTVKRAEKLQLEHLEAHPTLDAAFANHPAKNLATRLNVEVDAANAAKDSVSNTNAAAVEPNVNLDSGSGSKGAGVISGENLAEATVNVLTNSLLDGAASQSGNSASGAGILFNNASPFLIPPAAVDGGSASTVDNVKVDVDAGNGGSGSTSNNATPKASINTGSGSTNNPTPGASSNTGNGGSSSTPVNTGNVGSISINNPTPGASGATINSGNVVAPTTDNPELLGVILDAGNGKSASATNDATPGAPRVNVTTGNDVFSSINNGASGVTLNIGNDRSGGVANIATPETSGVTINTGDVVDDKLNLDRIVEGATSSTGIAGNSNELIAVAANANPLSTTIKGGSDLSEIQ